MHTINPFVLIFIFKNDMQEKETGTDGNFLVSGVCICSTSAELINRLRVTYNPGPYVQDHLR